MYDAAWIQSGSWHQSDWSPTRLTMIYLDPVSPQARGLDALTGQSQGISALPPDPAAVLIDRLRLAVDPVAIRQAIHALCPARCPGSPIPGDVRVAAARDILGSQAAALPTLGEIAGQVGLSTQRFRHLFRHVMGATFSEVRLWNRLVYAVRLLATKPDLTFAAHEAGFADSAHLSRTFRRTFGLKPSDVFRSDDHRLVLCD